jgi:hypothetical protein
MKKIQYLLFALFLGLFVASCSSDPDEMPAPVQEIPTVSGTMSELKKLATGDKGLGVEITKDIILDAIVVSNPDGNFGKGMYIQVGDEAIKLSVDDAGKTYKSLKEGQRVFLKAKGLFIGKSYDVPIIGEASDDKYKVKLISDAKLKKSLVVVKNEIKKVTPKVMTIEQLKNPLALVGTVVKIEDVQFTEADRGKTYYYGSDPYAKTTLVDAKGKTIVINTYKNASFKSTKVAGDNSGSIEAIVTVFNNEPQLMIRGTEDIKFTKNRFSKPTPTVPTPNKTIAEIVSLYTSGAPVEITGDFAFDGVVTSNQGESGAFYQTIYIQDETAAVKIYAENKADNDYYKTFTVGQKVIVNAKGLFIIKKDYGPNLVSSAKFAKINDATLRAKVFKATGGVAPTPIAKNIADLTDDLLMKLVKLTNVQVKESDKAKKISEAPSLTDANAKLVKINGNSHMKYKDVVLPEKSGSVIGVLGKSGGKYTITLRNTSSDVELTADRFTVTGGNSGGNTGGNTGSGSSLFPGSDFENWDTFKGALKYSFNEKSIFSQSTDGRNGSKALYIKGTVSKNGYVFTAKVPENFSVTGKTKIVFYIKGTSGKSLSLNLHKPDGKYVAFNLGNYSAEGTINSSSRNSYTGTIDTGGNWMKVTLNIDGLDVTTKAGDKFISLKVGNKLAYDLLVDDFTIE